jgi:hypothetical protein
MRGLRLPGTPGKTKGSGPDTEDEDDEVEEEEEGGKEDDEAAADSPSAGGARGSAAAGGTDGGGEEEEDTAVGQDEEGEQGSRLDLVKAELMKIQREKQELSQKEAEVTREKEKKMSDSLDHRTTASMLLLWPLPYAAWLLVLTFIDNLTLKMSAKCSVAALSGVHLPIASSRFVWATEPFGGPASGRAPV